MKRSEKRLSDESSISQRQIRSWETELPFTLIAPISPPLRRARLHATTSIKHPESTSPNAQSNNPDGQDLEKATSLKQQPSICPPTAAVEAGQAVVDDHLTYFTRKLSSQLKHGPFKPQLSVEDFVDLYQRNQNPQGRHYVIHQHDHPIAGTHYDLRLQFSQSSSISFAIMYGLPGNANSKRQHRNASETRVHNVWNHLIETASHATGSLLIWDTGEYEILPRRSKHDPEIDPDSQQSELDPGFVGSEQERSLSEPEKLAAAFKARKINIRFHGTRLPKDYTLRLRLTKNEDRAEQPSRPAFKRTRKSVNPRKRNKVEETPSSSDAEDDSEYAQSRSDTGDHETVLSQPQTSNDKDTALEKELQEQEDEEIRRTNAYPGATNSIGSIHQRKWLLSMDREASGFHKGSKSWRRQDGIEGELEGFEPFFVLGRDSETSVVTGRTADEVMRDEGVVDYIGRKGWRPVLE